VIVDCQDEAFGKATANEITHPYMLLTVDETGSNTNQKRNTMVEFTLSVHIYAEPQHKLF